MITVLKEQVDERWDRLPEVLREVLASPAYGNIVWSAALANHLDDARAGVVARLAGFVVLGLMHPADLAREIEATLNLNPMVAASIAHELDQKIFSRFKIEIDAAYSPALPPTAFRSPVSASSGASTMPIDSIGGASRRPLKDVDAQRQEGATSDQSPPVGPEVTPIQTSDQGPLILHKAPSISQPRSDRPFKGFSMPFKFLKPSGDDEHAPPVRARVEAPPEPSKRVVHYSELRTPLAPMSGAEDVIQLDVFEGSSAPLPSETPVKIAETKLSPGQTSPPPPRKEPSR